MYQRYIKRLLDIIISLAALVLLAPVLIVVAVLVRAKLGSPVIFHQERPGYHEKIFKLCKFRSMTDARGADGELLPDEVRLTRFEFVWIISRRGDLFLRLFRVVQLLLMQSIK